jgi:hypothetical protein
MVVEQLYFKLGPKPFYGALKDHSKWIQSFRRHLYTKFDVWWGAGHKSKQISFQVNRFNVLFLCNDVNYYFLL